jgi:cellulose synthase (UDP-forming)
MPRKKKTPITAKKIPNTAIIFLFSAPLIVLFYASFAFNPANAGNFFLYILQIVADVIAISVMLSLWLTIFMDVFVAPHHRSHIIEDSDYLERVQPTIDVLIPTAGEPFDVVKTTIDAAIEMEYPHHIFVLDDGKSMELAKYCQKLGIEYVTRDNRHFAKAGNLNNGMKNAKGEFFAIFDADQVPKKDFITKLLPYMENEKLGMVQSPQHFGNTDKFIAAGTAQAQEVFYKYLCPAKNISDSAFCVGTNVIFRRSAIEEIGGMAQVSHSEDIWTSRMLHERKWKTLFVNEILAVGTAPSTINSYFKQQLRWSKGGMSMFFLKNPFSSETLSLDQKLQYFFANMFYLVGFSMLIYISFPLLYLLFGISPMNAKSSLIWLVHYLPYFSLYYSLTWLLLGGIQISTIATSISTFYPYILAFFSIVFGTKLSWTPTTTQKGAAEGIMHWIWPHIFIIFLTIFSLIVGWFEPVSFWDTLISTIWALWNMYLLILFITAEKRDLAGRMERAT